MEAANTYIECRNATKQARTVVELRHNTMGKKTTVLKVQSLYSSAATAIYLIHYHTYQDFNLLL